VPTDDYPTIQDAVDAATVNVETIIVIAEGTYTDEGTESGFAPFIYFPSTSSPSCNKRITMQCAVEDATKCIIQGRDYADASIMHVNGGNTVTVNHHITFQGNTNAGVHGGGGIYNNADLTLNQCHVKDNSSRSTGGGIFNRGDIALNHCYVTDNSGSAVGS
jgi:hypothetical protein